MMRNWMLFFILFYGIVGVIDGQLPSDFYETVITDEIYRPVGIKFDDNGQAYVWERNGVVHVIDSSGVILAEPLIDISEEVGAWGDHGFLGFALHPDFLTNGYFYTLYVVDRHHLLYYGTDDYDPNASITHQATIGRITRFTADPTTNFQTVIENSRKVLLGETISTGFPILIASHGVGSLAFGTDGTLLASCGDGGSFLSDDIGNDENSYYEQALEDGILRDKENVGSFRAHLVDCLNGKIIRIDPETGDGVIGNPWFDNQNKRSAASRVWALGLRNPFRFIVRPESGSHNPSAGDPGDVIIGDVGGSKWEELNIATQGGQNFGYPLFEGFYKKGAFWELLLENPDALNPLYEEDGCERTHFYFQELIKQANPGSGDYFKNPCDTMLSIDPDVPTFYHSLPSLMYSNNLSNKPDRAYVPLLIDEGGLDSVNITSNQSPVVGDAFGGYSSIAGCFYDGDNFPEAYQGKYFHADYSWWIRTIDLDENNEFQTIERFHDDADYVLDLAVNPKDGCLYYVDFHSKIVKISYGGNAPPIAIAKFDNQFGPSPHTVNFEGSASYDPDGTLLDFYWDFGDGNSSDEQDPQHVFETNTNEPTRFNVALTVTDSIGESTTTDLIISLNNTPPEVEIVSVQDGDSYPTTGYTLLPLEADVFDAEHEDSELNYAWQTFLQHNTHEHGEPIDNESVTTTLIEPVGCNDEIYWFRIVLNVMDPAGLIGKDTSNIFPYCGAPPAELKYWKADVKEKVINLLWESVLETDLAYFEVQKMDDINYFKSIGEVDALGDFSAYQFSDDTPSNGINIYRLKMVKTDGVYDYSSELKVLFPKEPEILVFPNPSSNELFIELKTIEGNVEVEFFNYAGQSTLKSQWTDSNRKKLDVSGWPVGVYFYQLRKGTEIYKGKVLIMR